MCAAEDPLRGQSYTDETTSELALARLKGKAKALTCPFVPAPLAPYEPRKPRSILTCMIGALMGTDMWKLRNIEKKAWVGYKIKMAVHNKEMLDWLHIENENKRQMAAYLKQRVAIEKEIALLEDIVKTG